MNHFKSRSNRCVWGVSLIRSLTFDSHRWTLVVGLGELVHQFSWKLNPPRPIGAQAERNHK